MALERIRDMKHPKSIPLWALVCGSLLLTYLLFFVPPIFLNRAHTMLFPRYVPSMEPIGADLRQTISFSKEWMQKGTLVSGYPPCGVMMFCPLALLPFQIAYELITVASILAFLSVMLGLVWISSKKPDTTVLILLTFAGLYSYGLQFEIERGQFNVFAMACCGWAVYLFHRGAGRSSRAACYALFTASIQMKLYPAIFVFTLTRDAREWKQNVIRWISLGAFNVALLFVLGSQVFRNFLLAIRHEFAELNWVGNHSIHGWVLHLQTTSLKPFAHPLGLISGFVLAACLLFVLVRAHGRNDRSSFKNLVLMCALATLLIPKYSHDYKLPILSMAFASYLAGTEPVGIGHFKGRIRACLLFAMSTLHALTLYSCVLKPSPLKNNAPVLLGLCVLLVMVMWTEGGEEDAGGASIESGASLDPREGRP